MKELNESPEGEIPKGPADDLVHGQLQNGHPAIPYLAAPFTSATFYILRELNLLIPNFSSPPRSTVDCENAHRLLARLQRHSTYVLSQGQWILLLLGSLPFATAYSDTSYPAEREDSASITDSALLLFVPLAIALTIALYLFEFWKTKKLPKQPPELPAPVGCSVEMTLTEPQRNLVLHGPAVVWLALSIVILILKGVSLKSINPPDKCNVLNPDVAGLGVRVSLCVPAVIVMLVAVLGHFHAEETGVKGITVTLLVAQVIYSWNLWTKTLSPADRLVGSMILDCLTFITPITFSMKECLAARQLIRIGHVVQFFSKGILELHLIPAEPCPCFEAYWWGPPNSCVGASATFWIYLVSKFVAMIHGTWLCFWHMDHYDAAEKSTRGDRNTNIRDMAETVYDSIPATAFTKYRESIAIAIVSMANIELTLSGFDLPGSQDISSWGQTAQILVSAATISYFAYGFCSMWKDKNVERRQKVIRQCSTGALVPMLKIHRCLTWSTWIQTLHFIVRNHHPFKILNLRATNHCQIQYGTKGWKEIKHNYRKRKNLTPKELGAELLYEAEFGDVEAIRDLLEDGASICEPDDDGNTALIIASRNMHFGAVKLLLQYNASTSAQNKNGLTALQAALDPDSNNKDIIALLLQTSDITIQDIRGNTALHGLLPIITKSSELSIDEKIELINIGIQKASKEARCIRNNNGRTALFAAADPWNSWEHHYLPILRLYLEESSEFEMRIQDGDGNTVLHHVVKMILEIGEGVGEISGEDIGALKLLLEKVSNTEVFLLRNNLGNTALHEAAGGRLAMDKWPEMVKLLLKRTSNLAIQNNKGMSVLHCAVEYGIVSTDEIEYWEDEEYMNAALEVFELLLERLDSAVLSVKDDDGDTALHKVILYLYPHILLANNIIQKLIEKSCDLEIQNGTGETPLHLIVGIIPSNLLTNDEYLNALRLFELMLGKVGNTMILAQDSSGNTILHSVIQAIGETLGKWDDGWLKIVKLLLEKSSDRYLEAQNKRGLTALHYAFDTMNKLLGSGQALPDGCGLTGYLKVIKLLWAKAPKTAISIESGIISDLLHRLVIKLPILDSYEGSDVRRFLLEKAADLDTANKGSIVLHSAVRRLVGAIRAGSEDLVGVFFEEFKIIVAKTSSAAITIQDNRGNTPLHYATSNAPLHSSMWKRVVKLLLAKITDFGFQNNVKRTVPHCAADPTAIVGEYHINEALRVLKVLLGVSDISEKGFSKDLLSAFLQRPNDLAIKYHGKTLLHRYLSGISGLDEEVVRTLLGVCDSSAKDQGGRTPLHIAMENKSCNRNVLNLLLKEPSDITTMDNQGRTLLHSYISGSLGCDRGVLKLLLEKIDISAQDNRGLTALNLAVDNLYYDEGVIALLLGKLELVNYFTMKGASEETILHLSVRGQAFGPDTLSLRDTTTEVTALESRKQVTELRDGISHHSQSVKGAHGYNYDNSRFTSIEEGIGITNPYTGGQPSQALASKMNLEKTDQSISPHVSSDSFEKAVTTLLAETSFENKRAALTMRLQSELYDMTKLLLQCDRYFEIKDEWGRVLLRAALVGLFRGAKMMGLLLDNCVNFNTQDGKGRISIRNPISSRVAELVDVLIKEPANTTSTHTNDQPPGWSGGGAAKDIKWNVTRTEEQHSTLNNRSTTSLRVEMGDDWMKYCIIKEHIL